MTQIDVSVAETLYHTGNTFNNLHDHEKITSLYALHFCLYNFAITAFRGLDCSEVFHQCCP